jgi:serine/threonine-protein kinase
MVDRACALAYTAWMGERTGQPWRLPTEIEWEKAARGVDGRCYPWDDGYDPSWALNMQSHLGQPLMASVDAYLDDESP